ncbi:coiled-coil-helix-coiled-coil-helix domain-containing protein 7 isoform X1 [Nothobranchius furzeri]|uniref:coiled-coil-helix-coiled-coil-helix domain-containing protein 7 isoform X1 n=1 Tax=Nothobranchius furzeri TaxID=105023 RepID=UPI002403E52D|nr:coiled-coil-helix-coiled-coil-helix domain-containing protein 7 isoform X1 [Nothobranchius furzeri]
MDKNSMKARNQDINPCLEEGDASQKCLDSYNYDKSLCSAYFQRYKDCRKYWVSPTGSGIALVLAQQLMVGPDTNIVSLQHHPVVIQAQRDGAEEARWCATQHALCC